MQKTASTTLATKKGKPAPEELLSESVPNMEQHILSCAERLFLDKGFALTSTTEIAREAGCNQALVHYYFRTKEQLFQRIYEEKVKLFAQTFFTISAEKGSFIERLQHRVEAHFDIISQNPKIPFLIVNEVTTNPARIEALRQRIGEFPKRIIGELSRELEEAIQRGEVRPVTLFDLILTIMSLNILPFLMRPLFEQVMPQTPAQLKELLLQRRQENVRILLNWLKP